VADLITHSNFDGLVIAPFDSDRLASVVDKAVRAGIVTVAMDTPISSGQVLTFVSFNNFNAGRNMGEWVVKQLGRSGNALMLDGPQDQQNAVDRRNGLLAGLHAGNIEILNAKSGDWETEPASEITAGWLQKYPEVDVILAANDYMAVGAVKALAAAKRTGVLVTGFDATDAALGAIKAGQMSATVDQAPGEQARTAIKLLVRHLERGESFPSIVSMPKLPLVTKENVEVYLSRRGLK
jgi:ABC-type sugar transport system substrate-binding protein